MNVIKNPELRKKILASVRDIVTKEREGIHLSELIYCTRKAYYRRLGLAPIASDEQCLLWITGFAFQAYLFPAEKEKTLHVDDINCTPDIQSGIEVKSTRASMAKFNLMENTQYKRQILGYCKALDKTEYDLVVLFVCGNYKPPFPNLDCWHIVATQEEVEDNWEEMKHRANILVTSVVDKEPPEPNYMDWEYEYCECIELCKDTPCWAKKSLRRSK